MERPPLGEHQLVLLQWITENGPVTVRQAVDHFGKERKLARTTVITMMEALRKKGYLSRSKSDGAWTYASIVPQPELMNSLVQEFVQKTLGGSVAPFVAYLHRKEQLTEEEADELRKLADSFSTGETDDRPSGGKL